MTSVIILIVAWLSIQPRIDERRSHPCPGPYIVTLKDTISYAKANAKTSKISRSLFEFRSFERTPKQKPGRKEILISVYSLPLTLRKTTFRPSPIPTNLPYSFIPPVPSKHPYLSPIAPISLLPNFKEPQSNNNTSYHYSRPSGAHPPSHSPPTTIITKTPQCPSSSSPTRAPTSKMPPASLSA